MAVDYKTITLAIASQAIQAYNTDCYYSANKGLDLDRRARQLFTEGLALISDDILEQVRFIGDDYGGVAGFKAALSLAPSIAGDIYLIRDRYSDLVRSASPLRQAPTSMKVISEL